MSMLAEPNILGPKRGKVSEGREADVLETDFCTA